MNSYYLYPYHTSLGETISLGPAGREGGTVANKLFAWQVKEEVTPRQPHLYCDGSLFPSGGRSVHCNGCF